jgi:PTH1 family peptidyl-tRNA hydrolase
MIALVGLGNPGKKYQNTRHNTGFAFLDFLARNERTTFAFNKYFNAEIARISILDQDILFIKPQTFMNLSGTSVQGIVSYFHIPTDKVWVVHDDVDIELGSVRVRGDGSPGGHKGVQSIIGRLGTEKFPRFRIGIKTIESENIPTEKFVLQKFSTQEQRIIDEVFKKTEELLSKALKEGIQHIST